MQESGAETPISQIYTTTLHPMVRFGHDTPNGPRQRFEFHHIHDSIPEDAIYGSPIYLLNSTQLQRYVGFKDNPHSTAGEGNIVTELQDECERMNRVLYPLYVESDAADPGKGGHTFSEMLEWIQGFIGQELDVDSETVTYYFSGSRSIHAHVPYVTGTTEIQEVKRRARAYNKREGVKLDAAIYSRKRQFRLPGVPHAKTGVLKVLFDPDPSEAADAVIARAINAEQLPVPDSFGAVLAETFGDVPPETVVVSSISPETVAKYAATQLLGDGAFLSFSRPELKLTIPELAIRPTDWESSMVWDRYNEKEFSPYANAGNGNDRSVASVTVHGGPFCNREGDQRIRVPCTIHAAIGCDGEFVINTEPRPLQISKSNLKGWTARSGDRLVLIGGGNRLAIVHSVSESQSVTVALRLLMGEKGERRQLALEEIEAAGYNIGSSGAASSPSRRVKPTSRTSESQRTGPQRLQHKAEVEGINSLAHRERLRVAMSIMTSPGRFEDAWQWFAEQFGQQFDPAVQYPHMKYAAKIAIGYGHNIEIPSLTEARAIPV